MTELKIDYNNFDSINMQPEKVEIFTKIDVFLNQENLIDTSST